MPDRPTRNNTERPHHRAGDGSGKGWRNRIANLARAMPFRNMKTEPIRIPVKAGHFSHCDTSWIGIMNGTWTCESTTGGICPSTKRVAYTPSRQFKESRDRFDFALFCCRKALPRNVRMHGSHTGCQDIRFPVSYVATMPGFSGEAAQFARVVRQYSALVVNYRIGRHQFIPLFDIWQVCNGVETGWRCHPSILAKQITLIRAGLFGIRRKRHSLFRAEQKKPLPILRNAIVHRVQHPPGNMNTIP